jgi:hypothetical protein
MKPFDERLFTLKLHEPSKKMQLQTAARLHQVDAQQKAIGQGRGTGWLVKRVDAAIAVFREFVAEIDKACRETWLSDNDSITPEFIRGVIVSHVVGAMAARTGAIHGDLELLARRVGIGTELPPALQHLVREANRLQSDLALQYEIEAIELAKRAQREILPTSANLLVPKVRSDIEPENKTENVNWVHTKAETWRDLRERFQALAEEEQGRTPTITKGELLGRMNQVMRASFNYQKHPEGWERGKPEQGRICLLDTPPHGVWYTSDGISENFRERVHLSIAKSGVTLVCPRGADPEDFWLHRLYIDLLGNKSDLLFATSAESGMILSVCVASATFCSRLENKSLKQAGTQFETSQPVKRLMTVTDIRMPDAGLQELGLQDFSLHRLEKVSDERLLGLLKQAEDKQDWLRQAINVEQADPDLERMEIVGKQLRKELARRGKLPSRAQNTSKTAEGVEIKTANTCKRNKRQLFVEPILEKKGWSTHRFAVEAEVDFHTANDYLKNKTKPNRATRTQLAKALGISVDQLPR